jgi:hypothetical protein
MQTFAILFYLIKYLFSGDAKDSVREKAEDLILKLMEWSIQPQVLWERLIPAFNHRNSKVREQIHQILLTTLNLYIK